MSSRREPCNDWLDSLTQTWPKIQPRLVSFFFWLCFSGRERVRPIFVKICPNSLRTTCCWRVHRRILQVVARRIRTPPTITHLLRRPSLPTTLGRRDTPRRRPIRRSSPIRPSRALLLLHIPRCPLTRGRIPSCSRYLPSSNLSNTGVLQVIMRWLSGQYAPLPLVLCVFLLASCLIS